MPRDRYDHDHADLDVLGLGRLAERADAASDRAREVAAEVAALRVTRTAPGAEVSVTVDGTGRLVDVRFGDRVRAADPGRLGAHLLAALRRAESALPDLVAEVVDRDGPSETGRAVVEGYRRRFPPVDDVPAVRRPPSSEGPGRAERRGIKGGTTWLR